jgi:BlaI family penicillinase repressor
MKLFDSEIKVMEVLWGEGDCTAKYISDQLKQRIGWNMNTTYTVIKRLIGKGVVERREPNFVCHALLSKSEAQQTEAGELIDRMFDGAADKLFASLLSAKKLSPEEIRRLKEMIDGL